MKRFLTFALTILTWTLVPATLATTRASEFTPLVPLEAPKIIGCATPYPGGAYEARNLIDGIADNSRRSEYASASKGTETFVDFDFGKPTAIAAFKHVDRFDPATVDTADLVFSDGADFSSVTATVSVKHANTRGGVTFKPFAPVTARYVRWQVTAVKTHSTVGGTEISFFSAAEPEAAPVRTTVEPAGFPAVVQEPGKLLQPFQVTIHYPYAEPVEATLEMPGADPIAVSLGPGSQTVELSVPAVKTETPVTVTVKVGGQVVTESRETLKPVRPWVIHFLSHSHVDIGYTHVQTEVEQKQWSYLEQA
ncbi:MAG: discoidin domain-containing protein, partial [Planctomycetota bacterium]